jgi:serine/threonine protein kinase
MENEIVSGLENAWSLIRKLGEGDAGEVYLVASLAGDRIGVLKRPQKSAFTSDILRQAAQIKSEGQILKTLSTLNKGGLRARLKAPELLDQSKEGTGFSDRLFIVVEKAAGFDLGFLSRTSRMGLPGSETNPSQMLSEGIIG